MAIAVTHSTDADGTFSGTGATAWDAAHTITGAGTIATQDANAVAITGGSVTGITDLAIADGGTAASTARAASQNLNVEYLLKKSGVAASGTAITTEEILATIPTGALTANDAVHIVAKVAQSAISLTWRIRLGGISGTILATFSGTGAWGFIDTWFWNKAGTSSQYAHSHFGLAFNTSTTTAAIDTSVSADIVITCQKVITGNTMTLEAYTVTRLSDGT